MVIKCPKSKKLINRSVNMKNFYRKLFVFLLITMITTTPFSKINAEDLVNAFVGIGDTLDFSTKETKNWTWKSDNTYIATVKKGKITGHHLGYTVITASKGHKKYTWVLKVLEKTPSTEYTYIDDDSVSKGISKKNLILGNGDLERIFLNRIRGNVVWTVSNSKIVEIEPEGVACWVRAKRTGTTTIKAIVNRKTYSCKITIIKKGIKLGKRTITLETGKKEKIVITSADDLTATSYDGDIVDFSWGKSSGNKSPLYIKGLKAGIAYIDIETKHTNELKTIKVIVKKKKTNNQNTNTSSGKEDDKNVSNDSKNENTKPETPIQPTNIEYKNFINEWITKDEYRIGWSDDYVYIANYPEYKIYGVPSGHFEENKVYNCNYNGHTVRVQYINTITLDNRIHNINSICINRNDLNNAGIVLE